MKKDWFVVPLLVGNSLQGLKILGVLDFIHMFLSAQVFHGLIRNKSFFCLMYKNDIRGYVKLDKNSSKIKYSLSSCWLRYTVVEKLYSILLGEWLRYQLSMRLKVVAPS